MKKFIVRIARNETTVYDVEVTAKNEYDAEKNAYKKFSKGDYVDESVVYGEEETHEIEEITE